MLYIFTCFFSRSIVFTLPQAAANGLLKGIKPKKSKSKTKKDAASGEKEAENTSGAIADQ